MAQKRDAQTLLAGYRQKFPRYAEVDDQTLLSAIQKKYPQYSDISLGSLPNSENFLQKAMGSVQSFVKKVDPEYSGEVALKRLGEGLGDAYGPPTEFVNQAAFGLVRPGVKKLTGLDLPEASSPPMKIYQNLAGIAGFASGGPGRISEKAGSMIAPKLAAKKGLLGLFGRSLQRSVEGGVGGALIPDDIEHRKLNAKIGSVLGPAAGIAIEGAMKYGPKIFDAFNPMSTRKKMAEVRPQATKERITLARSSREELAKMDARRRRAIALKKSMAPPNMNALSGEKQAVVRAAKQEAINNAYDAPRTLQTQVNDVFETARKNYRNWVETSNFHMVPDDLREILERTRDNLKLSGRNFLDSAEGSIDKWIKRLSPQEELNATGETIIRKPKGVTGAKDLKNFKNQIVRDIQSNPGVEGEFYKNFADKVDELDLGYHEANEPYLSAYAKKKAAKQVTEGMLRRIGTGGDVADRAISDLAQAENKATGKSIFTGKAVELRGKIQKIADEIGVDAKTMGRVSERNVKRIEAYLEGLGKKRRAFVDLTRRRAEDITLRAAERTGKLSKELEDKYRNDIILGIVLGSIGARKAKEIFRKRV